MYRKAWRYIRHPFNRITDVGVFTFVLVIVAILQWLTFEKTNTTLRVEQRPWIDIDDIRLDQDITFDPNGAKVSLAFKLINKGHSPALNVVIWDAFSANQPDDVIANAKSPRFSVVDAETKNILFQDAAIGRTAASYVWRDVYTQMRMTNRAIYSIWAQVCARYQSTFESNVHLTCYSFDMFRKESDHIFDPNAETENVIPKDAISFKYWGASIAN